MQNNYFKVCVRCYTYNQAHFIEEAMNGFCMQEADFPFVCCIMDDASTDGEQEVIKKYLLEHFDLENKIVRNEETDDYVLTLARHKTNMSCYFAVYLLKYNHYRRKSKSRYYKELIKEIKYIAFCEGDDYWTDSHKLQKQFDFMENNPDYTLCGCTTNWLNMLTGKIGGGMRTESDRDVSLEEFVLSTGRPFPFVSFFLRAEIWKNMPKCGFPVGDLPLTYYAAMMGKVRMLADSMCVYRWNADGSWTVRKGCNANRAKICEKMIIGLVNLNEFSEGRYRNIIERGILKYKYDQAIMKEDFWAIMRNPELFQIFKKRSFAREMSDIIRCITPRLFLKIQILMGRRKQ